MTSSVFSTASGASVIAIAVSTNVRQSNASVRKRGSASKPSPSPSGELTYFAPTNFSEAGTGFAAPPAASSTTTPGHVMSRRSLDARLRENGLALIVGQPQGLELPLEGHLRLADRLEAAQHQPVEHLP